jgi:hypothetical protein
VREYDIYIPLTYNDGRPIESRKLVRLRELLLEEFGGLTFFPQRNDGFWTFGGVTYRDEIVIYRVFATKAAAARRYLLKLKNELKRDLKQEEILIVEKEAELL